ncbi:hypothetical protein EVAR_93189_1 [Eumeta japonica]|uniref:Uncharacterized protein n=1 Tax=Eumeta variegata TaxID=151549 RepID=A0A4C1TXH6_EUMVA|nr:hypothetical protein EVAR_93189_1 [Eumeta japonica]
MKLEKSYPQVLLEGKLPSEAIQRANHGDSLQNRILRRHAEGPEWLTEFIESGPLVGAARAGAGPSQQTRAESSPRASHLVTDRLLFVNTS